MHNIFETISAGFTPYLQPKNEVANPLPVLEFEDYKISLDSAPNRGVFCKITGIGGEVLYDDLIDEDFNYLRENPEYIINTYLSQ